MRSFFCGFLFLYSGFCISQVDSLLGIIDNKLVFVNIHNGGWRIKCNIIGTDPQNEPHRFSFSEKSNVFYGFINYPNGAHLYRITKNGSYSDLGILKSTVGRLYFAEGISVNRKTQKLYISASIDGGIGSGDFFSETILEVDTSSLICTPVRKIITPGISPVDADLISIDDQNNLFFFDGIPARNQNHFFKTRITTDEASSPVFTTSYFAPGDLTILNNILYYTHNRRLFRFDITTNQMISDFPIHNSGDFSGKQFRAISWYRECKDTGFRTNKLLCEGSTLRLTASSNGIHKWNTGQNSNSIIIDKEGFFTVETNDGCLTIDSFEVTLVKSPLKLPKDTFYCEGSTLNLDLSYLDLTEYIWNNGIRTPNIVINKEGNYGLNIAVNGCTFRDSFRVKKVTNLYLNLGGDTTICDGLLFNISPKTNSSALKWSDGSNGSNLNVQKIGTYWANTKNECFSIADSINVNFVHCDCFFEVPNAFTPDDNTLNDIFKPVFECPIISYEMLIFNRWGELLYKSDNPNLGWNGVYKNEKCMNGVYLCLIKYITPQGLKTHHGLIHLIR